MNQINLPADIPLQIVVHCQDSGDLNGVAD